MLEIHLDTADLQQIRALAPVLPLKGVTTNPSLLAAEGVGLKVFLTEAGAIMGDEARFHVQVVSDDADGIIEEARQLHRLSRNVVVKIPAHAAGLAALRQIRQEAIPTLATAIYGSPQGMMAALQGADYLAPYLNRMDNTGFDGMAVVSELQAFVTNYALPTRVLVASFKNIRQVMQVIGLGVGAVTVPVDIARQMIEVPATTAAVDRFMADWQTSFGNSLSFES